MQTGSCAAVDIVDKKNLPAGNYEEQDSFIVGDGFIRDWQMLLSL